MRNYADVIRPMVDAAGFLRAQLDADPGTALDLCKFDEHFRSDLTKIGRWVTLQLTPPAGSGQQGENE